MCVGVSVCLLIFLDTLTGHAVDDRVETGVHVPHVVGDGVDDNGQDERQPEQDVENRRILISIELGRVHNPLIIVRFGLY